MNSEIAIECALFRSAPGVPDEQLLAASAAVQDWLSRQPGYRSRLLARSAEGEWLDLVTWDSLGDAERAAAAVETCPGFGPLMQAMDPATVQLKHFRVQHDYAA